MILKKVTSENIADFEIIQKIYIESFPPNERRLISKFKQIMDESDSFTVNILMEDDKQVGFITYWTFDSFVFAEHFAINSEYRNGGFGKKALAALFEQIKLPLIIEVELPLEEMAKRRISFYERSGFKPWHEIPYKQPPYNDGDTPPGLLLMSYGNIDLELNQDEIIKQIHSKVYNKC